MFNNYPDLLTTTEACDMLRISRRLLTDLMSSGEMPNRLIRGKRVIPKGAAIQWYLNQPSTGYFPACTTNYDTSYFRLI